MELFSPRDFIIHSISLIAHLRFDLVLKSTDSLAPRFSSPYSNQFRFNRISLRVTLFHSDARTVTLRGMQLQ